MQYCVSGSASNLITLIYPDLQVLRDNTVILALRMHCRCAPHPRIMNALALRAPTDENFTFLIGKGILPCSIAYPDLHQI